MANTSHVHDIIIYFTHVALRAADRRKRHHAFHGKMLGKLPFDIIGMHDAVSSFNLALSEVRDTDKSVYFRAVRYQECVSISTSTKG